MITVKRLNVLVVLVMLLALAVPAISYASVPEGVAERSSVTEVEFTGVVSAVNEGSLVVDGQTVKVGPGTEIEGPVAVGDVVKVHARVDSGGELVAREIEASDHLQDNDNSNATDEINSKNDDDHMNGNDNDADQMNGNDNDDDYMNGKDNENDHMNGNDNDADHMNGNDNDDDHMSGNDNDDHHMNGNDNDDDHMSGNDSDDNHDNDHDNDHDNGHDNDHDDDDD